MRDYREYVGSIFDNEKKLWNKGSTSNLDFSYVELDAYESEVLKNIILKNIILKNATMKNELKILNIGNLNVLFSKIMADEGHEVTLISPTFNSINEAKQKLNKSKREINFRIMDKNALDFEDKTFDLIISSKITWELQSPDAAFREWRRVLKDDGTLIYFDSSNNLDISGEGRPSLDREILKRCGFLYVEIDRNIYKKVWNNKELVPFKPKSIFMVVAK